MAKALKKTSTKKVATTKIPSTKKENRNTTITAKATVSSKTSKQHISDTSSNIKKATVKQAATKKVATKKLSKTVTVATIETKKVTSKKAVVNKGSKEAIKNTSTKKVATKKVAAKKVSTPIEKARTYGPIKRVLISQPKPTSEKSPYYDLAAKYGLDLTFHQFIKVEGLTSREFKKQEIDLNEYSGIIMLSRNAVDHFFRICGELKFKVSPELRYFCASESVALYLQKFIVYRKRKVFFSADGSPDGLIDVMMKFSDSKFIMPVSEHTKNEMTPKMKAKNIKCVEAVMHRTVGNELSKFNAEDYDLILFFSPFGIEAALEEMPLVKENQIRIGTFGNTTASSAEEAGFNLIIKAPTPTAPSMITALDNYIKNNN